jgi:integrase
VFPHFGKKRIDEVASSDILYALSPIWLSKPETARRVKQRIGAVMDWARASGYRVDNPIEGIKKGLPKQKDKPEHHAALPYAKVPAFVMEIRKSESGNSTKLAFEFLILTATRTAEVLEAIWGEIDLDNALWSIPSSRMKAARPHVIPLSNRCLEILKAAKKLATGDGFVFPSRRQGKPLSNGAFLMILRRMNAPITAHGFRSTFRDWAAERTSFPREVAEACLAHTLGDATETAYLRTDFLDKRRKLMESWAIQVSSPKAHVLPFPAGKRVNR